MQASPPIKQALITIKEASSLLKVSPKTIYYWVGRHEIPYLKVGRHLRFDSEKVIRFFEEKTSVNCETIAWHSGTLPLKSPDTSRSLTTWKANLASQNKE